MVGVAIFWSLSVALIAMNGKDMPEWFIKAKSYKVLKLSSDSIVEALSSEEGRKKFFENLEKKSDKLEDELKDKTAKKNTEIKKSVSSSEYFEQ